MKAIHLVKILIHPLVGGLYVSERMSARQNPHNLVGSLGYKIFLRGVVFL